MPAIERRDLFAVPVFHGMLPGFEDHERALAELALAERAKAPSHRASNQGGFRSNDSFHLADVDAMRYLRRAVLEFGVHALAPLHAGFAGRDLALAACWVNVDGPGHFHTPHGHHPADWSGVVYVRAAAFAAPDPELRGGKIELLSPVLVPEAFAQPTGVTFTPKDGMVLLFPGLLQHLVHPHARDGDRISIAFNLDVVSRR